MLRLQVYIGSKNLVKQILANRVISSGTFLFKKDSDGDDKNKKAVLNSLLNELKSKTDDNLTEFLSKNKPTKVKDAKTKIKKEKKSKMIDLIKAKKLVDDKGKEFWFNAKKDKVSVGISKPKVYTSVPKSQSILVDEDNTDVKENNFKISKNTLKPLSGKDIKELEKEFDRGLDDNKINQLMSTLIKEVRRDDVTSEEKFQNLMTEFKAQKNPDSSNDGINLENRYLENFNNGRPFRRPFDLKSGIATSLFSYFDTNPQLAIPECDSLFELRTKEEIKGLLRENNEPHNAFEASILNIDKQWKFPIDNEQDMGIEDETSFDEHVFLDHLLEEFPENIKVQKFMELVITGLQQNAYLTVAEKERQVRWFKNYFEEFPQEDWITEM